MKSLLPAFLAGCAVIQSSFAQDTTEQVTEEVVVTATRFEDSYADKPVSVTVISSDEIRSSPARTIPDLLSSYAGLGGRDLFGNNGALATVDMRGFGAAAGQNTLILVDGRRQNDIDISGVQWSAIPLDFVERIEIVRGSGSVLYGDGATSGVINIITRKPGAAGTRASVAAGAGSFDTYSARVDGEVAGENAGLRIGGSYFDSRGYRDNNENEQSAAFADGRWGRGAHDFSLRFSAASQNLGLPGGRQVQPSIGENELETDRRGADTPRDYANRDDATLQFDWTWADDIVTSIVGLSYRRKEQKSFFEFSATQADGNYREVDMDVLALTPRLRFDHSQAALPGHLVVGFDWYEWDYHLDQATSPSTIGQPAHRIDASQRNYAIYVQEVFKLAPVTTVTAGARLEWFRIDATDAYDPTAPNPFYFPFNGAQGQQSEKQHAIEVGLRQGLTEHWSTYFRGARAYRFATVDEVYESSATFQQEFQFLRPQTSMTHELGFDWGKSVSNARIGIFRMDIEDEIHLDPFTSGAGNTNLPPSRRQGIELEYGTRPAERLDLRLAYTFTDAEFLEGVLPGGAFTSTNVAIAGKKVPLVARHRASLAAGFAFSERWRADVVSSYVSSQFMENDEGNTLGTKIPAYTVTDLRVAYQLRDFSVGLTVANLFDEEYHNYAIRSQFNTTPDRYSAYPLPGRNAFLEFRLKFGS